MKFLNWAKTVIVGLGNTLEKKGRYTTVLGLCIIIGSVLKPLIRHSGGEVFAETYMWQILYFIISGVILIILPSSIKFISKLMTIEIED